MNRRQFLVFAGSAFPMLGGCSTKNENSKPKSEAPSPSPTPLKLEEFETIDDESRWQRSLGGQPTSLASTTDLYVGTGTSLARISPKGKLRWQVDSSGVAHFGMTATESTVYHTTPQREVVARDASTGNERWRRQSDKNPRVGHSSDSAVVITTDFEEPKSSNWSTFALDEHSDEKLWEVETGTSHAATLSHGLSLVWSPEKLYAIEMDTGDIRWQYPINDSKYNPLRIENDTVYLSTASGIIALTLPDGKQAWRTSTEVESLDVKLADAAIGNVIAGTYGGTLFAIDSSDGDKVWSKNVGGRVGKIEATYLGNGKAVVITYVDDSIRAFDASTGEQQWHQQFSQIFNFSGPVIIGDTVLVLHEPTQGTHYLKSFDLVSGQAQWLHQIDHQLTNWNVVQDVFVFTTDNESILGFEVNNN